MFVMDQRARERKGDQKESKAGDCASPIELVTQRSLTSMLAVLLMERRRGSSSSAANCSVCVSV